MKNFKIIGTIVFISIIGIVNFSQKLGYNSQLTLSGLIKSNMANAEEIFDGYLDTQVTGSQEVCMVEAVFVQTGNHSEGYWRNVEICRVMEIEALICKSGGEDCIGG